MPAGQPTKYRPEYCEEIVEYFQERLDKLGNGGRPELPTFERFSAHLGISTVTLYNWANEHPEFFKAKQRAAAIQHACLIDGALCSDFASGPATLAMKNLLGWRDKFEGELNGKAEIRVVSGIDSGMNDAQDD